MAQKKETKIEPIGEDMEREKATITMEPPDGGWGWIIVAASAMSNFIAIPILQSFGLLFRDAFVRLNMTTKEVAVIINVNSAFGMSLGLINGPLFRRFGYRKVAIAGSIFSFIGVTATSWANSFAYFIISYSILTSMGGFLLMSSFSLALNTYFWKRRGRAAGMATTFTGLGPVIIPQLITLLLDQYDVQGTTLILGGLSLHSVAAALLLQPVKWHMKPNVIEELEEEEPRDNDIMLDKERKNRLPQEGETRRTRTNTINSVDYDYNCDVDCHSVYGFEAPLVTQHAFGSSLQLSGKRRTSVVSFQRSVSQVDDNTIGIPNMKNATSIYFWHESTEVNLASSTKTFDEKSYYSSKEEQNSEIQNGKRDLNISSISVVPIKTDNGDAIKMKKESNDQIASDTIKKGPQHILSYIGHRIVVFFDLGLLCDPGYVILMIGMSLAVCAELNFSLFTPLILDDFGFSKEQTATFMSVVALADIVFRFLAPFIGDYLKFEARTMYLFSLLLLILTRVLLILYHDYEPSIAVAVSLGIAKGFRTVYMSLVIPSYVPLNRLASASGIQMVTNSIFIVASIPIMAYFRELSGSYSTCIAALNCITFMTVSMWTVHILYLRHKKPKNSCL